MINNGIAKIKKIFLEYPVEITSVITGAIGYVVYVCIVYSVEVLFLASFQGDVQNVEKFFNGTLIFNDLLNSCGEHGLLGYNFLLLINASFFNYTSQFDLVINSINVIICGFFLIYCIRKSVINKNISYYFGVILVSIVMFSPLQGSSATMETQVRLGLMFFLLGAYFVNIILIKMATRKTVIAVIFLIFLGINVFGTFYSFAGLPVVFLFMLIFSIKDKKINRNFYILALAYMVSTVLYFVEYNMFAIGKGSILKGLTFWLLHPESLLKAIFSYNASAILGYAVFADKVVPVWIFWGVGFLVTFLYLYSGILFIGIKMYKITVMPILLQGYTLFVLILVLVGRYQFDWRWITSSWYQVHTKLGLAGSIWIIIYALSMENKDKLLIKSFPGIKKIITTALFLVISCGLVIGFYAEIKRAPYVRAWYQNIANYMYVEEAEMPVDKDGNTPFLVNKSTTMKSLNILKKYELSAFKKNK